MHIDGIRVEDYVADGILDIDVTLDNEDHDIDDVTITAVVHELGLKEKVGPFDVDGGKITKNIKLFIPSYAEGLYDVRITIRDTRGELRRVVYRDFIVR